jgi:hypothetical protein
VSGTPPFALDSTDRAAMAASAGPRLALIAESFARLTGTPLVEASPLEPALWLAPRAIVAHGTEAEPLFFYGNRLALELFGMRAAAFIGLPSHRSAEPGLREERARMLARLEADDLIDDYSGVRISADGRRFQIARAHVWNLVDEDGRRHGQAASFAEWRYL